MAFLKVSRITRRQFNTAAAMAASATRLSSATSLDETLRTGITRRGIPTVVAMVAEADRIVYRGAFGIRDKLSRKPVTIDSLFDIASMTKAVASVAAMQLVEQGTLKLDEPVSRVLPELGTVQVIDGFNASGTFKLRPVRTPITLKHLLTHTSGFAYDVWSPDMARYTAAGGRNSFSTLAFEPGTRWQYGFSTDWAARVVERASGMNLEQYVQRNIFAPLAMADTSYILPANKFERFVYRAQRTPSGDFLDAGRKMPSAPTSYGGGGGLYSTAPDYIRFLQMFLRRGAAPGGKRILSEASVDQMTVNQIGSLSAGKLKSSNPMVSADVDLHPGVEDRWGLGFLINQTPYEGGRAAGSLAWAGINNTHFWIDPKSGLCAVIMMAFLPFVDPSAVQMLSEFERAVYAG